MKLTNITMIMVMFRDKMFEIAEPVNKYREWNKRYNIYVIDMSICC